MRCDRFLILILFTYGRFFYTIMLQTYFPRLIAIPASFLERVSTLIDIFETTVAIMNYYSTHIRTHQCLV